MSDQVENQAHSTTARASPSRERMSQVSWLALASVVGFALAMRLANLDRASLWFDETVSMRVARAPSLTALVQTLDQIDGSRAVLHPVILQLWLRLLGPSDGHGRLLSVVCGMLSVFTVYQLAKVAFDRATGLWAAWLMAVCPPLVYYSREVRMYAWLVLLTTISWLVFLSFRKSAGVMRCVGYTMLLAALVYSHPVGLFMAAAHGLAYLLVLPYLRLNWTRWLLIQFAVLLLIAPWIPRYLDHGTDYPIPRYPLRYLLAVPIEFIGGNRLALLACLIIVAGGMVIRSGKSRWLGWRVSQPVENVIILTWAAVPPVLMYAYSYLSHPIFGPPRYHLFIAPAYLILVAHGLTRLPPLVRWLTATLGLFLSITLIQADPYTVGVRADWRGLANWLERHYPDDADTPRVSVIIHPSDPRFPRDELETARYYLSPRHDVVMGDSRGTREHPLDSGPAYHVYCIDISPADTSDGSDKLAFDGLIVRQGSRKRPPR